MVLPSPPLDDDLPLPEFAFVPPFEPTDSTGDVRPARIATVKRRLQAGYYGRETDRVVARKLLCGKIQHL